MKEYYQKYLINEVSKIFNIGPGAVRHYEKMGLIEPFKDSNTKYRNFDILLLEQLSNIVFFRSLELSLDEIFQIKDSFDVNMDTVTEIMQSHIIANEEQINYLRRISQKTEYFIKEFDKVKNNINKIVVKKSPKLLFTSFGDVLDPLENARNLYHLMNESSTIPKSTFILDKEKLVYNANINLNSYSYFGVSVKYSPEIGNKNTIFPSRTCAHTVCVVRDDNNFVDLWEKYRELINWIHDNNYYPSDFAFDQSFLCVGNYSIFEIYIPIEPRA